MTTAPYADMEYLQQMPERKLLDQVSDVAR